MSARPAKRQRFEFVAQDAGGHDVPVIHRLRSWLKAGLRGYGIRIVSGRQLPADDHQRPAQAQPEESAARGGEP
jgi:hypothetical protein